MRVAFVRCASVLFCCLSWPFAARAAEADGAENKEMQEITLVLKDSKDKQAILSELEILQKQIETRGVSKGPTPTKLSDLDEKTRTKVLELAERMQKEAIGQTKGAKAGAKSEKEPSFIDLIIGVLYARAKSEKEKDKVNTPNAIAGVRG